MYQEVVVSASDEFVMPTVRRGGSTRGCVRRILSGLNRGGLSVPLISAMMTTVD